jgi:threonine/homoserine/homoserine lactone efflux protein
MPSLSTLLSFFAVSLLLGVTPGPDNLFVLLQSVRGPRSGMVIVWGLCTGLLVHTFVVAIGLGALLMTSEVAFTVLKGLGAAYLLYLAWGALRAPGGMKAGHVEHVDTLHLYRRGLLMNLSNPKVVIFFLAFLPQFVVANRGHVPLQIVALGITFVAASLIVFSLIAFFSGISGKFMQRSTRSQKALNRFAGLIYVALAAKLASTHL